MITTKPQTIKDLMETFPADQSGMLPNIVFIDSRPHLDHGQGLTTPLVDCDHIPALDPDYLERPDLDTVIIDCLQKNRRLLLVGDAGCGKSSALEQVAARLGWPCRRVNLNGETGVSEFVGQWVVKSGEMTYQYGILPTAMRDGQMLVLDEYNAAQPEVLFILQPVAEGGKLFLPDTGETVEPHPNFRLMATANDIAGDSGLYAGTRTMNAASLDRFDVVFRVSYPEPKEEAELLKRRTSTKLGSKIVAFFTDLREAVTRGDLAGPFSTRRALTMAYMLGQPGVDTQEALRLAVTDRLSIDEAKIVREVAQRHFGE